MQILHTSGFSRQKLITAKQGSDVLRAEYMIDMQVYKGVVSSGGAPTPAGTSVFTKHNWDIEELPPLEVP